MKTAQVLAMALVVSSLLGCTRSPLRNKQEAMRPVRSAPAVQDDLSLESLAAGLDSVVNAQAAKPAAAVLQFGAEKIVAADYAAFLREVRERALGDKTAFLSWLQEHTEFNEVYGSERWGEVLLTGYFEPLLQGSLTATEQFSQPLYGRPPDLVEVPLSLYDERFFDVGTMRGRLEWSKEPPRRQRLLPYYTRAEIDGGSVLAGKGLELAYADPVDVFFMQIQGAGRLQLASGEMLSLGYADQNGHGYQAIGKFLPPEFPRDQLTQSKLEGYLRSLDKLSLRALLNKNPSYVFYDKRTGPAITAFGTPVVDGRTIATDTRFFPKGTLALLEFELPGSTQRTRRLVLDTDTGGAIRGGGRVDLFYGSTPQAKQLAGDTRSRAWLYYLLPRNRGENANQKR